MSFDKVLQYTNGGAYAANAAAATATTILTGPGRICRIVVLTSGTAETVIYDNTAVSGTNILHRIPADPTVGTVYDVDMPVNTGITLGATNTSGVRISYNQAGGPNGQVLS